MSSQVVTSNEGENENEFDFNAWIIKWELSQIKYLFIKHNATTPSTLTVSSPEFQSLIIDPVLFSMPTYIQKLWRAMQNTLSNMYMLLCF